MSNSTSQRIVDFISQLHPAYCDDRMDGKIVAVSLDDGTIYACPVEQGAIDQDLVDIFWQGNKDRKTSIQGSMLAANALARYSEICTIPHRKEAREFFEHIANHIEVKIGDEASVKRYFDL